MFILQSEERQLTDCLSVEPVTLGELQLAMCEWPRQEGVAIAVNSQGVACTVWLPANLWQAWCKGLLGTDGSSAIDPLLLRGIAEWGLSPLLRATKAQLSVNEVPLACCSLAGQLALTVYWKIEQYDFRAMLFGWPPTFLKSIVGQITPPVRPINPVPPISFPLYIGWGRLSLAELNTLRPGVGVGFTCFGDAKTGDFVIQLPGGISARVSLDVENNTMTFNERVQDMESLLDEEHDVQTLQEAAPVDVERLPLVLLIEVGQVSIELGKLRQLKAGDVLAVRGSFASAVTLRLNGRALGQGELVSCDGQFLVRIGRWYLAENTANT